jgi:hypothetical protein
MTIIEQQIQAYEEVKQKIAEAKKIFLFATCKEPGIAGRIDDLIGEIDDLIYIAEFQMQKDA